MGYIQSGLFLSPSPLTDCDSYINTMISFKILRRSRASRARLGIITTPNGEVETPSLVPVATQAVAKTLTSEMLAETGTQIAIANTFHLHLKPGEAVVNKSQGLHKFMNWKRPLMTDSGGFQIFSLGFGRDLNLGKILKYFDGRGAGKLAVNEGRQPNSLRILEAGVFFKSPLDGRTIFMGPQESIAIQEKLGADIMFAFDECTPPTATRAYIETSLARTHRWAKISLRARQGNQALFGIVQGSRFKPLREASARFIGGLGFDGFGIGGDLGSSKATMQKILNWTLPLLPETKPRHLLGIGALDDIPRIIASGVDTFDCTIPTHYARRGIAFTSAGRLNLGSSLFLKDQEPLDSRCQCPTCLGYRRTYIAHLIRAKEITGLVLLTQHNLFYFNHFVATMRERIKRGTL